MKPTNLFDLAALTPQCHSFNQPGIKERKIAFCSIGPFKIQKVKIENS
jgi:hypothetical protein